MARECLQRDVRVNKKDGSERNERKEATRLSDSDRDNHRELNCRCEVRRRAVKTRQVERGSPVGFPSAYSAMTHAQTFRKH